MKEKMSKGKIITITIVAVVVVIFIVLASIIIHNIVNKPWENVKNNAIISIEESKFGTVDIALYSTGTGIFEKLYLGMQPNEYYVMENGDVYHYREPNEKGKITRIEYGRIFEKIGKVEDIDALKNRLITSAQLIDPSYKTLESTTNYKLKVNNESYNTGANLYQILNSYTNKEL